jgi:hypothetical protein
MKNFPVFYFSRRAAAIIREIDETRCFLDNTRQIVILIYDKFGAAGNNDKNAH